MPGNITERERSSRLHTALFPPSAQTFALCFALWGSVVIKVIHSWGSVIPVWQSVCDCVWSWLCVPVHSFFLSPHITLTVSGLSGQTYCTLSAHCAHKNDMRIKGERRRATGVCVCSAFLCAAFFLFTFEFQSRTRSDLENLKSSPASIYNSKSIFNHSALSGAFWVDFFLLKSCNGQKADAYIYVKIMDVEL